MDGVAAKGRVLIVDDQFLIVEFLRIWVEASGFEVCGTANSAAAAIQQALELRPDVVLMDMQLDRGGDGRAAATEICQAMDAQIIFVTGSNDAATMARITADQPFAVLIKPVDPMELGQVLAQAMAAR